jgi:hypothetical protein
MQRILILSVFLVAIGMPHRTEAETAPRIKFDQLLIDVGATSQLARVTGAFTFRNEGSAPLEIGTPATVCSCTDARTETSVVQPGERGRILFTSDAAGAVGPKTSEITVPTNDPTQEKVKLTLKVNWIKEFDLQPSSAAIGAIGVGTSTNLTVRLSRMDGTALSIAGFKTSAPNVRASLRKTDNAAVVDIDLSFTAEGEPRFVQESVSVRGPTAEQVLVEIPVYAHLRQSLLPTPQRLMWVVTGEPGPYAERKIRITNYATERPLKLTGLTCSVEGITFKTSPAGEDNVTEVVAVLEKPPASTVSGTIRLDTNFPDQPLIEIPFKIQVMKKP